VTARKQKWLGGCLLLAATLGVTLVLVVNSSPQGARADSPSFACSSPSLDPGFQTEVASGSNASAAISAPQAIAKLTSPYIQTLPKSTQLVYVSIPVTYGADAPTTTLPGSDAVPGPIVNDPGVIRHRLAWEITTTMPPGAVIPMLGPVPNDLQCPLGRLITFVDASSGQPLFSFPTANS
jgi:hypothetical protein